MMSLSVWLPGPMFLLGVFVLGPLFVQEVSVKGFQSGECLSGGVSVWEYVQGVSVHGWVSLTETSDRDPLYDEELAVRILLECFLVANALKS